MKYLTFNVRINLSSDLINAWPNRVKAVADVIQKGAFGIVGLQEPNLEMVSDLLKELPNYRYTGLPRDERNEMTPILYNPELVTLIESKTIWLSATPDIVSKFEESHFPRIATIAVFETEEGRIRFVNTHLDYANPIVQRKQMTVLIKAVRKMDLRNSLPTIIVGDFNAVPSDTVIEYLRRVCIGFSRITSLYQIKKPGKTYHGFQGGRAGQPIDYIYTTDHFENKKYHVNRTSKDGLYPSDHYPIEFSLNLKKQAVK